MKSRTGLPGRSSRRFERSPRRITPRRSLDTTLVFHNPDSNRLAFWSLISGIASFSCLPFLGAVPAVILGHRASKRAALGRYAGGRVIARFGLFLGYLNMSLLVAFAASQLYKVYTR